MGLGHTETDWHTHTHTHLHRNYKTAKTALNFLHSTGRGSNWNYLLRATLVMLSFLPVTPSSREIEVPLEIKHSPLPITPQAHSAAATPSNSETSHSSLPPCPCLCSCFFLRGQLSFCGKRPLITFWHISNTISWESFLSITCGC